MAETARPIVIRVNGTERSLGVERSRSLLSVLRTELGLTGTKYGCGSGECGACTVLLQGQPVRACTTPVSHAEGRSVTTIEGLVREGQLHPVQQAFLEVQAFHCGYCTPGMIMEAVALLRKNPNPTELTIREEMAGHLCRCGTYGRVIRAIQSAAAKMRK
ncbi:MAG TPA: (2Fe-2S)-binding protein [Armatimonadota bacterium]|nr:(2Fe-2S)-binding protein [Armatimonadota bacterium]